MQKNRFTSNPKVLVVGGNPVRWSAHERESERSITNGIEAWVYAFNGDYCTHKHLTVELVSNYDVVICNSNYFYDESYIMQYLPVAQKRPQHVHWVTLLEGNMLDYVKPTKHIREYLDSSDLINCINRFATAFIQELTITPVRYVGIPYPVDGIKALRVQHEQRIRNTFICPFLLQRWTDYFVAKHLGLPYGGYEEKASRKLKHVKHNYTKFGTLLNKDVQVDKVKERYRDTQLTIEYAESLECFFMNKSNSYLWVNMDERYTWGRYVLDAAALGIPIITTPSTGHGEILFPKTTVAHPFDIEQAVILGKRLIEDETFYREVIEYADSGIELYKPEIIKDKLLQELKK